MATLEQLYEVSRLIGDVLQTPKINNQNKDRYAGALFHVADCHFQSIVVLFEKKMFASAFALLRALVETTLRGVWISSCASDADAERAVNKDDFPGIGKIPEMLETQGLKIELPYVKQMHSYTHGGAYQIVNHLTGDGIEPSFDEGVVNNAMTLAGIFGLFAAVNVALLAKQDEAVRVLSEQLSVIAPKSQLA